MLFVAEILDRFVVQQAFDRLGVGLRIGLVHLPPELGAPFRHDERVRHVEDDGRAGGQGQPGVEHLPQHDADQPDLEEGRQDVEEQERQQRLDAFGAALDGAAQAAGLARQVEAQRQRVQVPEDLQADRADGVLADAGEDGVAQFGKQQGEHPRGAVGQDQPQGHRDRSRRALAQFVHGLLVQQGNIDRGRLGGEQAQQRRDHAGLQARLAGRPEVGEERAQRMEITAAFGPRFGRRHGADRVGFAWQAARRQAG
ncbi:hypothetical protein D9M68_536880 [compost metagenome]